MTIERGRDWGRRVPRPGGIVEVDHDADAAVVVNRHRREGSALPLIGLLGGDMRRTLGGAEPVPQLADEVGEYTIDLGVAEVDGQRLWFVSHLIAREHWWRGEVVAVMNAEFVGRWDVAPRSHPNDGRLDALRVADMGIADRWKAWRRLPLGTHLPHPSIGVSRASTVALELRRPTPVWLDGVQAAKGRVLRCWVEPDALTVCI